MNLAAQFAGIARGFSALAGAPFVDASALWPGTPEKDAGGSIVTPGMPETFPVSVQFDAPSHAMRLTEGFQETDARLLVLAFDRDLNSDARVVVTSGIWAGTWALLSVVGDPAGVGWECRGRRVTS